MRISAGMVSDLNKKMYERIDKWRKRPIEGQYPYVYFDGICLKRSWGGEVRNVSVQVAIGVGTDGFRDVIGIGEGGKESWSSFLRSLKKQGLKGVRLVISDKCLGLVESLGECLPDARWQRRTVHFYRNIFSVVPHGRMKVVAAMLKVIHAQEDITEAQKKACAVADKLEHMKLHKAAGRIREGAAETLGYYHCFSICQNSNQQTS
jgi:transposase-like protein